MSRKKRNLSHFIYITSIRKNYLNAKEKKNGPFQVWTHLRIDTTITNLRELPEEN